MLLLITSLVHATVYTPEDLVVAHARGLPAATTAQLAEGVGTDAATAVYLLRRGVSADALTTWGYTVGEAERAEAARLGVLAAAPSVEGQRPWADASALTAVVHEKADPREALPARSPRRAHASRGALGTGAGALLTVAGGISFLAGTGVTGLAPNISWSRLQGEFGVDQYPSGSDARLLAVGAIGLLAGGVTLHFGARELRLAGAYPGGWEPAPAH